MTQVHTFEFNPFAENTYVVYDDSGECIIFDPGCYTPEERQTLRDFIDSNGLRVVRLINTHCHLDHVFGNHFVSQTWDVLPELHKDELPVLEHFPATCMLYGIPGAEPSPLPQHFLEAGTVLTFGNTRLDILYTPGHSPASLSFYCQSAGFVLAGDVLFLESIGRTDLPGGDYDTLIASVRNQLFPLPGETIVYPGHGPATTIRHEKEYNPFF
ncbi:MAG: MBL fold metallo-hydrolase [Bacteroidetes bacterium]|nr:MAG: MBL fold metallo-hydrolase [Bacteroidota bacterium]